MKAWGYFLCSWSCN